MSFSPEKIAKLRALSRKVRRLPKVVAQRTAAAVADDINEVALETFDAGENAYGETWKPGKKGQHVTLVGKTGRLRSAIRFVASGVRLRVRLGVSYAKYQIGKRPVFPRRGQALPASYLKVLRAGAIEAARDEMETP